jgi:uracil-DNA glycosylase
MRSIRPLIVGEAPSRVGDPSRPITGACGDRLACFCGVEGIDFRRLFARMNLLSVWPGRSGKGTKWDRQTARAAADVAARRFVCGRVVVCLGWRVADALSVKAGGYFEPVPLRGSVAYVVPHPSGINRWYNERSNVAKMRRFMRRLAREAR